ncbi:MAG: hypothetical protein ACI4RA_01160 [Kiritimatiellia bacterium]
MTGKHRSVVGMNDGVNTRNVVVNDGVKEQDVVVNVVVALSTTEERAIAELLRNPRLTASALSVLLETSPRQAQRIMASLKKKAGLRRIGLDKTGSWKFDPKGGK